MLLILNRHVNGGSFKKINMHPIDKRNKTYASIIAVLAIAILAFYLLQNTYFLIALGALAIVAMTIPINFPSKLVLLALWVILIFPLINLTDYLFDINYVLKKNDEYLQFMRIVVFVITVSITPMFVFTIYYVQVVRTAKKEKKYYNIIEKYPHTICSEHHTRTKKYNYFTYKGLKCRIGKRCLVHNNIKPAIKLVGLIGMIENGKVADNNYYVTLWDHRYRKIRYGDYDVIEIHENPEVWNYDFIISKIILFFTNEIRRFKPMSDVSVVVVGHPPLAENTKRLLEDRFKTVEFIDAH